MKFTALFFAVVLFWGLKDVRAQEEIIVTDSDKEIIARELEKESKSGEYDQKTSQFLGKVSDAFKNKEEQKNLLKKIGRGLGKGAAWISTKTSKPFMISSAFIKGAVEKSDKNKDVAALYQFFLNHQESFDDLYLEAGTPDEMIELMLAQMEEIMQDKTRVIVKDFLAHLGIEREIPEDLNDFELTAEEIASIDESKIDPDFINSHPEFQEVKPLVGEMTKEEVSDLVASGYFSKAISFENYKSTIPSVPELVGTVVGQLFVPKIALGIISKTLASLYFTPVVLANVGTAVSAKICLEKSTQEKFGEDKDLKLFCSYVTNKSSYELMKGRAKGYVAGKKFHEKVKAKIKKLKQKREAKRSLHE